jgi:hypothetical protein
VVHQRPRSRNKESGSSFGVDVVKGVPITAHGRGTFDDATVDLVND